MKQKKEKSAGWNHLIPVSVLLIVLRCALELSAGTDPAAIAAGGRAEKLGYSLLRVTALCGGPLLMLALGRMLLGRTYDRDEKRSYYRTVYLPFLVAASAANILNHIAWCIVNHLDIFAGDVIFQLVFLRDNANPPDWAVMPLILLGALVPSIANWLEQEEGRLRDALIGTGIALYLAIPNMNRIMSALGLSYSYWPRIAPVFGGSAAVVYFMAGGAYGKRLCGEAKEHRVRTAGAVLVSLAAAALTQLLSLRGQGPALLGEDFFLVPAAAAGLFALMGDPAEIGGNAGRSVSELSGGETGYYITLWLFSFPLMVLSDRYCILPGPARLAVCLTAGWFGGSLISFLYAFAGHIACESFRVTAAETRAGNGLLTRTDFWETLGKWFFYAALVLYAAREISCSAMFDTMWCWSRILYDVRQVSLTFALFKIFIDIFLGHYSRRELLLYVPLTFLLRIGCLRAANAEIYVLWLMVLSARGMDIKKIVKTVLCVSVVMHLVVFATTLSGIVEERMYLRGDIPCRYSLGFKYTTTSANNYMHMAFMYLYLRREKLSVPDTAVLLALNAVLFRLTDTRSAFLFVLVGIAGAWILKLLRAKLEPMRFWRVMSAAALPVSASVILVLTFLYTKSSELFVLLNRIVNWRLMLGHNALFSYGLSLFGNKIVWVAGDYLFRTDAAKYNYVDSSYVQILVNFGLIALVTVLVLAQRTMLRAVRERDLWFCMLFGLIILHSILDPQFAWLYLNVFLFYRFAAGDTEGEQADDRQGSRAGTGGKRTSA